MQTALLLRSGLTSWPQTQGDHKEREYRALIAWRAAQAGVPVAEIASEFGVQTDTAARWIRDFERELDGGEPPE